MRNQLWLWRPWKTTYHITYMFHKVCLNVTLSPLNLMFKQRKEILMSVIKHIIRGTAGPQPLWCHCFFKQVINILTFFLFPKEHKTNHDKAYFELLNLMKCIWLKTAHQKLLFFCFLKGGHFPLCMIWLKEKLTDTNLSNNLLLDKTLWGFELTSLAHSTR